MDWAGVNMEDLSLGIQPFAIVLRNYISDETTVGAEAQEFATQYDTVMDGASTTLADAKVFKSSKAVLPSNMVDARAHLEALMILWTTLLGATHPFVTAYADFLNDLVRRERQVVAALTNLDRPQPKSWLFLRFVHIKTYVYWDTARAIRSLPPPPNFAGVINQLLKRSTSWVPELPVKYWPSSPRLEQQ